MVNFTKREIREFIMTRIVAGLKKLPHSYFVQINELYPENALPFYFLPSGGNVGYKTLADLIINTKQFNKYGFYSNGLIDKNAMFPFFFAAK